MFTIMGGLFVVLLCFDMGIKQYMESTCKEKEERETVLEGIVLRKIYNRGFMLNILEDKPKVIRSVSAGMGAVIILYDVRLFLKKGKLKDKLGMVFISAGAASNIYDRLIRGKVIDYIGVKSKYKFLSGVTVNLADVYIAAGTAVKFI